MSHYSQVRTQFKDREALVQALEACGYKPQVFEQAQHLYGYRGDVRPEVAEIVIPRAQLFAAANDLGFKSQKDGTYSVIRFDYGRHLQDGILQKVTQRYATIKATKTLKAKGYQVKQTQQADGSVRLVAQRW